MKHVHVGDKGNTKIFNKDVGKDEVSVDVLGNLDELNSFIGVCRHLNKDKKIDLILEQIQKDLFSIGSEIGSTVSSTKISTKISREKVVFLDDKIVEIENQMPELKRFILPGGSHAASVFHVARSVCRRTERSVSRLSKEIDLNENIIPYVNRLSDLLFALARFSNKKEGVKDVEWNS